MARLGARNVCVTRPAAAPVRRDRRCGRMPRELLVAMQPMAVETSFVAAREVSDQYDERRPPISPDVPLGLAQGFEAAQNAWNVARIGAGNLGFRRIALAPATGEEG